MESNTVFSFSRFWKLLRWQWMLEKRTWLLTIVFLFVLFYIVLFSYLNSNSYNPSAFIWQIPFIFLTMISAFVLTSFAFPLFRSKEGTFEFVMLPATNTEKYFAEFLTKFLVLWVIILGVFLIASSTALWTLMRLEPACVIQPFTFERPDSKDEEAFAFAVLLFAFAQSLAFASAVTFRKQPLLKMIAILAFLGLFVFAVLFFSMEVLQIRHPIIEKFVEKPHDLLIPTIIASFSLIVSLTYSFFKLKEKQIV